MVCVIICFWHIYVGVRVFCETHIHIYGLSTTNISPEIINMIGMTWLAKDPEVMYYYNND